MTDDIWVKINDEIFNLQEKGLWEIDDEGDFIHSEMDEVFEKHQSAPWIWARHTPPQGVIRSWIP